MPRCPHYQSPVPPSTLPMTKTKRRSRDLQGTSHAPNTVYIMNQTGRRRRSSWPRNGKARAGQGTVEMGGPGGQGGRNRMEGGILYMHHESGSLNLSLSPTFSPHLTTIQRDAHTHTHHTSRNQPDRERQRREGRAGPQRKKGKQASIWETEFFLYPSIHKEEGGQGTGAADENHTYTPPPHLLFLLSLNSVYLRTPFLWSFFLVLFLYSCIPNCFVLFTALEQCPFLRIGHRIEGGENQGDTCCCQLAGGYIHRWRAGTRTE